MEYLWLGQGNPLFHLCKRLFEVVMVTNEYRCVCFCFCKNFNFEGDVMRIRMEIVNSILNFIVQGRPPDRDGEVSFLELTLDTLPAW